MVEEGEERPVEQPSAVLELSEGLVEEARVDDFFELVDFLHGGVPVYGEDFAGEFAPCGFALFVAVGCLSGRRLAMSWFCKLLVKMVMTYQDSKAIQ